MACTGDGSEHGPSPGLPRADTVPAPAMVVRDDTSGIGALIARHFPGYHLSTEQEIAARFPLTDGSQPADYYPAWGSGRTWWIWSGDTDRDGASDRVVLLTSTENPANDLLVALHANGTTARITEPGGWGVELEDGDVLIVAWEKAADRFRWDGTAYVPAE